MQQLYLRKSGQGRQISDLQNFTCIGFRIVIRAFWISREFEYYWIICALQTQKRQMTLPWLVYTFCKSHVHVHTIFSGRSNSMITKIGAWHPKLCLLHSDAFFVKLSLNIIRTPFDVLRPGTKHVLFHSARTCVSSMRWTLMLYRLSKAF